MRILLTFSFLCLLFYNLSGQTTVSPMNIASFIEAPFKFKGHRVIMGDRVDTELTKNIFLFTKTYSGAIPDTLFAQQFQKNKEIWSLVKDTVITSDETIIFWGNRKGFFDKNGLPVAFFTYCTGNPSNNSKSSVNIMTFYQGSIYSLTEYRGQDAIQSKNFSDLSSDITQKLFDYWNKLDKWENN